MKSIAFAAKMGAGIDHLRIRVVQSDGCDGNDMMCSGACWHSFPRVSSSGIGPPMRDSSSLFACEIFHMIGEIYVTSITTPVI